MNVIESIVNEINNANKIIISTHANPDGDGLGSQIALYLGIKKLGKYVIMINSDNAPKLYQFLPHINEINSYKELQNIDIGILIECCSIERVGKIKEIVRKSKKIINIDHHPDNKLFGDINFVDSEKGAVGELVYDILIGIDKDLIDKEIAICLYTSILSDTGRFSYSNTTSNTLEVCSKLLKYGVNPYDIALNLYESHSYERMQLLSIALKNIEFSEDRKVAWITLKKEMFDITSSTSEDTEGFVNYARAIKGVEVAILFQECANNEVKVSLRSKRNVNVNEIAHKFNGGGHERSAGFRIKGNIDEIKAKVIDEVCKVIRNHENI